MKGTSVHLGMEDDVEVNIQTIERLHDVQGVAGNVVSIEREKENEMTMLCVLKTDCRDIDFLLVPHLMGYLVVDGEGANTGARQEDDEIDDSWESADE